MNKQPKAPKMTENDSYKTLSALDVELRRLYAENASLRADLSAVKLSRDVLLEALRNVMYWDNGKSEWKEARTAIKAVEEAK